MKQVTHIRVINQELRSNYEVVKGDDRYWYIKYNDQILSGPYFGWVSAYKDIIRVTA